MNDKLLTGNRKALFLSIAQNPGISQAQLCASSYASGGELHRINHHLMGLESEGLIVAVFRGKRGQFRYRIAKGKGEKMLHYLQIGQVRSAKSKPAKINPPDNWDSVPKPRFQCGQQLQWKESEGAEWGIAIGCFYSYARHQHNWQWGYLIWLDSRSPSAAWCQCDMAWEEDLEFVKLEDNL